MQHCMIPDCQVRRGVPTSHITAAGNYLADHLEDGDKVINIGDFWDFPSLSAYDKPGEHGWESKSLSDDFESGNEAMADFMRSFSKKQKEELKFVFTIGNHEYRLERAANSPEMRRFKKELSYDRLNLEGWKVYPFLKPAKVDGIMYCHYFVNPKSLYTNPIGGTIDNKLDKLKCSFSMGHQQTYQVGTVYGADGRRLRGLVCGRFYQHDEEYLNEQKNAQSWSGILVKHEVKQGNYDLMEVSMNYLLSNWL